MKLTIESGDLDLQRDFAFELERTNPFFSDEGDATVPATLPPTECNRKALDHIERIDRMGDNLVDVAAQLQVGAYVQQGRLIVEQAHRREGYNVSFAIENSSLYCRHKDKTLKEIMGDNKDGAHTTLQSLITYMNSLYSGNTTPTVYTVVPVAVSKYTENDQEVYQVNNEWNGTDSLVYERRIVREGDVAMTVPDGYGVAPFMFLHRMLSSLFAFMGYKVGGNCFHSGWMSSIIVLHNCSDAIVNGELYYRDMVPSCTLSELLQWLKDKFHVCVRVDSEDKTVYIVPMETLLETAADADYSAKMDGYPTMHFSKSSRVVLSSQTNLDGAAPAADTFDALMEKYGGFFPVNETIFANMRSGTYQYHDCLIFRIATGEFFEIRTNLNTGFDEMIRLGTNYFKYDRANSDDTEEHACTDEMPPMVNAQKYFAPYIGDRKHAHTTFNGSQKDEDQPIMIALVYRKGSSSLYQSYLATTQGMLPSNTGSDTYLNLSMVNYHCYSPAGATKPKSIYDQWWHKWNTQLRNGIIEVEAALLLDQGDLSGLDMTAPKMISNRKMLPKSLNVPLQDRLGMTDARFVMVKDYPEMDEDEDVDVGTPARLHWVFTGSETLSDLWAELVNSPYYEYSDLYGSPFDNGLLYDQDLNLIENPAAPMHNAYAYIARPTGDYELEFTDGITKLYAHTPTAAGETSPATTRGFTMKVKMARYTYDSSDPTHYGTLHDFFYIDFPNQWAEIEYEAEAY